MLAKVRKGKSIQVNDAFCIGNAIHVQMGTKFKLQSHKYVLCIYVTMLVAPGFTTYSMWCVCVCMCVCFVLM